MVNKNYLQDSTGNTNTVSVNYLNGVLNKRAQATKPTSFFNELRLIALSLKNAGSFFFS